MATPRSRHATLWLQILLIGGLACVVILFVQSFRLARSNQSVVERALRDYADFAAWSYAQHLTVRMRDVTDEMLGAVNHGDGLHTNPRIPSAQEMGHFIPEDASCNCHRLDNGPMPRRFLAFALGSDTLGVGLNMAPEGYDGWLADVPMGRSVPVGLAGTEEARWINALLSEAARGPSPDWGYRVIIERREDQPVLFGTRSMPTSWGDTLVYAYEYTRSDLDSLLQGVLSSSDLLPAAIVGGRQNADLLDLEVQDAHGAPLFVSGRGQARDSDVMVQLPESYGSLRILATIRYDLAEAILIGGVPESRVPLLLVLLLLALGLTLLAAVQLRREVRFAGERATFVANVSHELRTPLAQIRLVLDTLRLGRGEDPDVRRDALQVADREALRLQHLVEGVLRFTPGSRRRDQVRVPVDAAAEVQAVIAEFEPLGSPHGLQLTVQSDEKVPATMHPGALRQVLLNLLDNAMKYGGDGTRVVVDVRALPGGGVRLQVDDNGPGVPRRERERIWRSFQRGGEAERRATGGSGIGLTIVQQLAQEHGGRAWVEDAPGRGARFMVEFPGGA
jgi:signal transduction histidine kinase